ncbi:MAG: NAD(P)H-hydrate dehydratase, partial [Proteobacteria bacterium]|nr:NAD(P)H-hydrate dehydratase [Pseudomonadota bacterium]
EVRMIDIGVDGDADDHVIAKPWVPVPAFDAHKYSRGMVAVIAGKMPGAAALCVEASMRAGAGYALLLTGAAPGSPHAIVYRTWSPGALDDKRIGAVVVGPGLGRDAAARDKLEAAMRSASPLLIDGDALTLLDDSDFQRFRKREAIVTLTPHAGEFAALFGEWAGSKIEAARRAAKRAGAYVVFKGPDTVIAAPFGDAVVSSRASPWLSTAGTGDVLAGTIAAMIAGNGAAPIHMIAAGVWMHTEAARRLGGAFIADDLARELSAVRASL